MVQHLYQDTKTEEMRCYSVHQLDTEITASSFFSNLDIFRQSSHLPCNFQNLSLNFHSTDSVDPKISSSTCALSSFFGG